MFDREIDRAIDDVAGEMTAGEPAPDLRARVLARIDARSAAPAGFSPRTIAAAAVTVVVVVAGAIAVMLLRGFQTTMTHTTATVASRGDRGPERAAPQQKMPMPQQNMPAPPQQPPSPEQQTRAPQLPNVASAVRAGRRGPAPQPGAVAVLAPPPLDVESIALGALAPPPPLEIEQLEPIAPIAITPLGEGDRP